MTVTASCR